jgi:hypothetical protein
MADARQNEINDSMTVVATTTLVLVAGMGVVINGSFCSGPPVAGA